MALEDSTSDPAFEDNLTEGVGERIKPSAVTSGGYRDHLARYLFAGHFAAGRSVVDLCCGNGYGSHLLEAAGAVRVTGIDIAADAIATAREHYAGPKFEVGAADAPLDLRQYDVAVCFEGIEHVADPDRLLANMAGAGVALVSSPNSDFFPGGFSGNPHHLREWTRREFEEVLARHFSDVRMYFQWHYPDPLDLDRRPSTLAKAVVPVSLKRRLRSSGRSDAPPAEPALPQAGDDRANYRLHRATSLGMLRLLPGLRYGQPSTWTAVCHR
ncbi:MAG TPA: methyltransferase domain-containing protein [Baekduia sp.]|nr:methyltransferase domain-containing protein [Baekduia sp.]